MSRPRSLVLLLTILALIYMAANRPQPVEVVEVKYCPVMYWTWVEGADGRSVKLWHKMYGPCSDMDRYEDA